MKNPIVDIKGQVFTVAKIHYVNGVVYFTAQRGETDLKTLANNYPETIKSGKVKIPSVYRQKPENW